MGEVSHDAACTALLMPTLKHFEESTWTIEDGQVDCSINQRSNILPPNLSREKQEKWTLAKVNNFQEWADRNDCPNVCDAAFAFLDLPELGEFPFSLSFLCSKSEFFQAQARWRSESSSAQVNRITFIGPEITTDPRIVHMVLFWVYTDTFLDVHMLTNGTCNAATLLAMPGQHDVVAKPSTSVDLLELYKLAHFLGLKELKKKIKKYCFKPSASCSFNQTEEKLACLMARCSTAGDSGEEEVVVHVAEAYVRFTRGLACLCRWPLLFNQKKWDILMKTGRKHAHHWFAHVVPLYTYIFMPGASASEVVTWAAGLGLQEAAETSLGQHIEVSHTVYSFPIQCMSSFNVQPWQDCDMRNCLEFNELGVLSLERLTSIPHIKSLQRTYKERHGIDLANAFEASNRAWILPWAHMMAACSQIACVTREKGLSTIFPEWLQDVCMKIITRYSECEDEEVFIKCSWLVDRILLGPMNNNQGADAVDLSCCSSRDLVILQVCNCINKICRKMGGLRDLSTGAERSRLPLYYVPQILDAVCDALSMAAHAKLVGFTVKVSQTTRSRKRKDGADSQQQELAVALDSSHVLKDMLALSSSAEELNGARTLTHQQLDQGGLW